MHLGQRPDAVPRIALYAIFAEAYGWDFWTVRDQPEWALHEHQAWLGGKREAQELLHQRLPTPREADVGAGLDTAEFARQHGLLMPGDYERAMRSLARS